MSDEGTDCVEWLVASHHLESKNQTVVLPEREIQLGHSRTAKFKMMLNAKCEGEGKGQQCFKKSKGVVGFIEIKCLSEIPPKGLLQLKLAFGEGAGFSSRGAILHDFSEHHVARFLPGDADWDFRRALDSTSNVLVTLEMLPAPSSELAQTADEQGASPVPNLAQTADEQGAASPVSNPTLKNEMEAPQATDESSRPAKPHCKNTRSEVGRKKQHERHLRRLLERHLRRLLERHPHLRRSSDSTENAKHD